MVNFSHGPIDKCDTYTEDISWKAEWVGNIIIILEHFSESNFPFLWWYQEKKKGRRPKRINSLNFRTLTMCKNSHTHNDTLYSASKHYFVRNVTKTIAGGSIL